MSKNEDYTNLNKDFTKAETLLTSLFDPEKYQNAILIFLQKHWSDQVGNIFAAHSIPLKIQKKSFWELQVAVDHSMWSQEISFQKPAILEKINRVLSLTGMEIRELRFKVQHNVSFPKIQKDNPRETKIKTSTDSAPIVLDPKIKALINGIEDPNLRKALMEIAKSLNRNNENR